MYKHYRGDPHWIAAKYPGVCGRCGGRIERGEAAFYYPSTRAMYCGDRDECGPAAERDFVSCAQDEYNYSY